jgi:hypothetical protein
VVERAAERKRAASRLSVPQTAGGSDTIQRRQEPQKITAKYEESRALCRIKVH